MADYCMVHVKFSPIICGDSTFDEQNKTIFKSFANIFIEFDKEVKDVSLKNLINNYFQEHYHAILDNRHTITYLDIEEDEIKMDIEMAYGPEDIKIFYDIIYDKYDGATIDFVYTCYGNNQYITTDPNGPLCHVRYEPEDGNWWDEPIYKDNSVVKFLESEGIIKINNIAFRLYLFQLEKEKKFSLLETKINAYFRKMYSDYDDYHIEIHKYVDEDGRSIIDTM